ncbi:hypothetical protein DFS34DRAFT_627447 [Phlyctochytrium arcticum]|nr:hypothetical protein DFS34DRAFT_627447 [Phlyctochytrium arcticum]
MYRRTRRHPRSRPTVQDVLSRWLPASNSSLAPPLPVDTSTSSNGSHTSNATAIRKQSRRRVEQAVRHHIERQRTRKDGQGSRARNRSIRSNMLATAAPVVVDQQDVRPSQQQQRRDKANRKSQSSNSDTTGTTAPKSFIGIPELEMTSPLFSFENKSSASSSSSAASGSSSSSPVFTSNNGGDILHPNPKQTTLQESGGKDDRHGHQMYQRETENSGHSESRVVFRHSPIATPRIITPLPAEARTSVHITPTSLNECRPNPPSSYPPVASSRTASLDDANSQTSSKLGMRSAAHSSTHSIPSWHASCACTGHEGLQLLDAVYGIRPSDMILALFGDDGSPIWDEIWSRRGCTDIKSERWRKNRQNQWSRRRVTYKVYVRAPMYGKMLTVAIEDQRVVQQEDNMIVIDVSVITPSLPSGTVYSSLLRYCLTSAGLGDKEATRVRVHGKVEFSKKSMLQDAITNLAVDGMSSTIRLLDETLVKLAAGQLAPRVPPSDVHTKEAKSTDILPDDLLTPHGLDPSPYSSMGPSRTASFGEAPQVKETLEVKARDSGSDVSPAGSQLSSTSSSPRMTGMTALSPPVKPPQEEVARNAGMPKVRGPRMALTPPVSGTRSTTPLSPPVQMRKMSSEGYFPPPSFLNPAAASKQERRPSGPRPFGGWEAVKKHMQQGNISQTEEPATSPLAVEWNGKQWVEVHPVVAKQLVQQSRASTPGANEPHPPKVLKRAGGQVALWVGGQYIVAEGGVPRVSAARSKVQLLSDTKETPTPKIESVNRAEDVQHGELNAEYVRPSTPASIELIPKSPQEAAEWRSAAARRLQSHLAKQQEVQQQPVKIQLLKPIEQTAGTNISPKRPALPSSSSSSPALPVPMISKFSSSSLTSNEPSQSAVKPTKTTHIRPILKTAASTPILTLAPAAEYPRPDPADHDNPKSNFVRVGLDANSRLIKKGGPAKPPPPPGPPPPLAKSKTPADQPRTPQLKSILKNSTTELLDVDEPQSPGDATTNSSQPNRTLQLILAINVIVALVILKHLGLMSLIRLVGHILLFMFKCIGWIFGLFIRLDGLAPSNQATASVPRTAPNYSPSSLSRTGDGCGIHPARDISVHRHQPELVVAAGADWTDGLRRWAILSLWWAAIVICVRIGLGIWWKWSKAPLVDKSVQEIPPSEQTSDSLESSMRTTSKCTSSVSFCTHESSSDEQHPDPDLDFADHVPPPPSQINDSLLLSRPHFQNAHVRHRHPKSTSETDSFSPIFQDSIHSQDSMFGM